MFMSFLIDFWFYLHEAKVWWQIVVIALCLVASRLISRYLCRRFTTDTGFPDVVSAKLITSIYFPAVLFVLLCIGKLILLTWENDRLLSLLIPIVGSLAVIRFGTYLSRRIFAHSHQINSLHLFIERIFSTGVWTLVIFYYTGLLHDMLAFMDQHFVPIGHNRLSFLEVLEVLISVAVTVLLALWASAALDRRLLKVESLNTSLRLALSRLGRSLFILCAILIGLSLAGIDLTILSIFGGALGVGLGLGLQRIASSYVSGFIILFDRSLTVDDLITVDKYTGKVSQINTRYTILRGLDGIESFIPNEILISSPVKNSSLSQKGISINTRLTVAYKTDIESLLPMLIEVVSRLEGVAEKSSPAAHLSNFGKNGLELSIWFPITNPADEGGMVSKANRAIWKLLKDQNVEIPYSQAEVTIVNRDDTATNHT